MLRHHIRQAEERCGALFVEDQMRPSDALFGALVDHLRRPLHSLVRFYLDLFAERQAAFNFVLADALATFSQELDALLDAGAQRDLAEVRWSLVSLSERAAQLERKVEALQQSSRTEA